MKHYRIIFSLVFAATCMLFSIAAPPVNDNFTGRIFLPGASGNDTADNTEATLESGEPTHIYDLMGYGSNSIWYTWTAPSTATFSFDTIGSTPDLFLTIYTGSSIDNLTRVRNGFGSVSFSATDGTVYQIAAVGEDMVSTGQVVLNYYEAEVSPWVTVTAFTNNLIQAFGAENGSLASSYMKLYFSIQIRTNQFGGPVDAKFTYDFHPQSGVTINDKKGNTIVNDIHPPNAGNQYYMLDFDGKLLLVYNQENSHVIAYKVKKGFTLLNEQTVENNAGAMIEGSKIFVLQSSFGFLLDSAETGIQVFDKKLKKEKWSLPFQPGTIHIHSLKKELVSRETVQTYNLNVVFSKKGKKKTEHNVPLSMFGITAYCPDMKGGILHWIRTYNGVDDVNSPLTYIDKKNTTVFENKTLTDSGNIWEYDDDGIKNLITVVPYGASTKIISYKIDKNMKKMGEADVSNYSNMEFDGKELTVYQKIGAQSGFTRFNSKLKKKWTEPISPGELSDLGNGVFMRVVLVIDSGDTNLLFKIFNKKKTISEHSIDL